jgi:hypothetical protein
LGGFGGSTGGCGSQTGGFGGETGGFGGSTGGFGGSGFGGSTGGFGGSTGGFGGVTGGFGGVTGGLGGSVTGGLEHPGAPGILIILFQVITPTIPSATSPHFRWNIVTASRVAIPKIWSSLSTGTDESPENIVLRHCWISNTAPPLAPYERLQPGNSIQG